MHYWSQLLTRSFIEDPLFQYAFGGSYEQRCASLDTYFQITLDYCMQHGYITTAPENSGIIAWISSKAFPPHIENNRIQNQPARFREGWQRFQAHEAIPENYIQSNGIQFGYLWLLAVDESFRGGGYARWLIHESLEQMQDAGLKECWLSTEQVKNIPFYERMGFKKLALKVDESGIICNVFCKSI